MSAAAAPRSPGAPRADAGAGPVWGIGLQLALALALIHLYEIEGEALRNVFAVACAGWIGHRLLPPAWRLLAFLGVAATALVAALGPADAAWVIVTGGAFVGLCLLPGSRWWRLAAVVAAATGLAVLRAGVGDVPWDRSAWAILSSLFLFRAISYLYDRHHERERPSAALTAAYFFLPPNACFPVFPVVDYAALKRGYDPAAGADVHQEGIERIVRGLIQLLAYRLVYHLAVLPIEAVDDAASAVRHLVTNVFLIVRIMGIFHVSIGILHLFGFRLPPTTHLPFLSPGFSEFWRRANVYWRDFVVKVFFYPAYFQLKRAGRLPAMAAATLVTFAAAWFLHSYQWFWFRGDFPLRWQDGVYWSLFGVLVTVNTLWIGARGARRRTARVGVAGELARALRISGTFAAFALLWSVWMTPSVEDWTHMLRSIVGDGLAAIPPILLAFGSLGVIGIFWPDPSPASRGYLAGRAGWAERGRPWQRAPAAALALASLLALMVPGLAGSLSPRVEDALLAMADDGDNEYDRERRTAGYYQRLAEIPQRLEARSWQQDLGMPDDWDNWREAGLALRVEDPRRYAYRPSFRGTFKQVSFSTNSFGLRDREYTLEKPPDAIRIAVLGASVVSGSGVADGEAFEALLERRIAEEHPELGTVEILNFAAPGYRAIRSLAQLEFHVLDFDPDYVMLATENHAWRDGPKELAGAWKQRREVWPPEMQPLVAACADGQEPDRASRRGESFKAIARCLEEYEDEIIQIAAKRMSELARERGFQLLWAEIPTLGVKNSRVPLSHRAVLESLGFVRLDASDAYGPSQRGELKVAPWDGHPNAQGHQLIADALYPQLMQTLAGESRVGAVSEGG